MKSHSRKSLLPNNDFNYRVSDDSPWFVIWYFIYDEGFIFGKQLESSHGSRVKFKSHHKKLLLLFGSFVIVLRLRIKLSEYMHK